MSRIKEEAKGCNCLLCKRPKWMTREEHLREVGWFLGYPKCCVEELINDNGKWYGELRLKAAIHKGHWTAFIPCQKHAERIINEGKSLARLIRNRVSSSPFPHANMEEFKKHIQKLKRQHDKRTRTGSQAQTL